MQGGGNWGPPGGGPPAGGGAPPGYGGPPQQQYGHPQQGYGAPPGGYGAPMQQGYAQAPQQFGYGAPQAMAMPYAGAGTVCPRCQSPNTYKAGFTWWGGILGPWLLNHQVCRGCGLGYNRKTGKSNMTAIAIYFGVIFGVAILLSIISAVAH